MGNSGGKSSFGLEPNIAATLSYALVWTVGNISYWIVMVPALKSGVFPGVFFSLIIPGALTAGAGFIFFVLEKQSRFVRVHAMQAILFAVLWFASEAVITGLALVAGIVILGFPVPASIAFLLVWLWLMVKAYRGEMFKLPIIGELAENLVAK